MAQQTKDQLKADVNDKYQNNIIGRTQNSDINSQQKNIIDSMLGLVETAIQAVSGPLSFLAKLVFPNVIFITKDADWPDMANNAVLGRDTTTLTPNIEYFIMYTATFGARNFYIPEGGNVTFKSSRYLRHTYSGDDDFITVHDAGSVDFFNVTYIGAGTPKYVNYSAINDFQSWVFQNGFASGFDQVASIENAFVTSCRQFTTNNSTSGIVFVGSDNSRINDTGGLHLNYTGKFYDFDSVTDLSSIKIANTEFSSTEGASTAITFGANTLSTDGRAVISNTIFNGAGNSIDGISNQETQIEVDNCEPVTLNTAILGCMYVDQTGAPFTITNPGVDTWTPVTDSDMWSSCGNGNRFDLDTDGILHSTSIAEERATITGALFCRRQSGSGGQLCQFRITKSDDDITYTEIDANAIFTLDTDNRVKAVPFHLTDLMDVGTYFRIEYRNTENGGTNLYIDAGQLIIRGR